MTTICKMCGEEDASFTVEYIMSWALDTDYVDYGLPSRKVSMSKVCNHCLSKFEAKRFKIIYKEPIK